MFDKTREKIKARIDRTVSEPIRNSFALGIVALVLAVLGLFIAVSR